MKTSLLALHSLSLFLKCVTTQTIIIFIYAGIPLCRHFLQEKCPGSHFRGAFEKCAHLGGGPSKSTLNIEVSSFQGVL